MADRATLDDFRVPPFTQTTRDRASTRTPPVMNRSRTLPTPSARMVIAILAENRG